MAGYRIEITDDAKVDLSFLRAYERKIIISNIKDQLSHEPETETRSRKRMRHNPIGPWELRIGRYRAFYTAEERSMTVSVVSIGWKVHNVLYIRGQEVKI